MFILLLPFQPEKSCSNRSGHSHSVRSRKGSAKRKAQSSERGTASKSPAAVSGTSASFRQRRHQCDDTKTGRQERQCRKSMPNILDGVVSSLEEEQTPQPSSEARQPPFSSKQPLASCPNGTVRAVMIQTEEEKVKEAIQVKWECQMGPKYTILVRC